MENCKEFLIEGFRAVVEDLNYDERVIRKYFSTGYVQYVDGQVLDFNQFCEHMKVQKQALKSIVIDFKTVARENNIVFTNHVVKMETKEGRIAIVQVIAEFHVLDGKITYCNELTHLLSGDKEDRDLGSRH